MTARLNNSIALLRNVTDFATLIERVQGRPHGLPGLGVYYGPSGFGKTTSATWCSNEFDAYHVEVRSCWTGKKLCSSILVEMSIEPARTIADMVDQIAEEIGLSQRPLIIDEADYLIQKNMIEIVRDIHECSGAPVLLIGEERLPQKLQKFERVHGRVLDWVAAKPACRDDVDQLAPIYCPEVELGDDFKDQLLAASNHSIRRVSTNLFEVHQVAKVRQLKSVHAGNWKKQNFVPAIAPVPRRKLA